MKFNNQPAPPKVGVTAAESGTYTDFCNINVGGLRLDGSDGVNEVSYLLLDVIDEMRLLQPSSNIQLSKKSPGPLPQRACEIIRKGWGQPSVFNADMVVEELLRQGKRIEDARAGGTSGCVETGAFGKEAYILTGYFNLAEGARDHADQRRRSGARATRIGAETGDPATFDDLRRFLPRVREAAAALPRHQDPRQPIIERLFATRMPAPFLSLIIDDCIAAGIDYNAGGARYNTATSCRSGLAPSPTPLGHPAPRVRTAAGRDASPAGHARRTTSLATRRCVNGSGTRHRGMATTMRTLMA